MAARELPPRRAGTKHQAARADDASRARGDRGVSRPGAAKHLLLRRVVDLELEHRPTCGVQLKIAAEILKARRSVARAEQVSHNPEHSVPLGTGSFMASDSASPQTQGGSLVRDLMRSKRLAEAS